MRGANFLERNADGVAQVQVVRAPFGNAPVEQALKRRRRPCARVHAVGDRVDREVREHALRHFAVLHRHAVHEAREAQRDVGHVERAARRRSAPPRAARSARRRAPREDIERELVVAGRHRRVRREHAAAADRLDVGLVELERLAAVELPLEQAERQQRRVAFVEVVDLGRGGRARGGARRRPSRARLPGEPIVTVAAVQVVGQRAVELGVFRKLGVEQIDRHFVARDAADRILPGPNRAPVRPSIVTVARASTGSSPPPGATPTGARSGCRSRRCAARSSPSDAAA